jgi:outer membrane lipoprotein-sorting protein
MNSLDKIFESFATGEPPADMVSGAQERLEAVVNARASATAAPRARPRVGGWLAAGISAAAAAVVVVILMPLTSTPVLAFSAVREHFQDFRTLQFDMTQEVAGQKGLVTHVAATKDGKLRTDVGKDLSVIVNTAEGHVLTLIHPERVAMESPIGGGRSDDDSMRWLDDIRQFQGAAVRLPEPRTIDGRQAFGWKLRAGNMDIVLWATEGGLPLQMQMTGEQQMRFEFHFQFDVPLPDEMFSTAIPAGYRRATAED